MNNVVAYLMAQNAHEKYLDQNMVQVNAPLFLPSRVISLSLQAIREPFAWIVYRVAFGGAMIPHQFNVRMSWESGVIFSGIVSGQLIQNPFETFSMSKNSPLNIQIQNLRNAVGYFELSFFYLTIQREPDYQRVIRDIRALGG